MALGYGRQQAVRVASQPRRHGRVERTGRTWSTRHAPILPVRLQVAWTPSGGKAESMHTDQDAPGTLAQRERLALADLLDTVGPDAPTLCAGWRTRDLAAHLVTREGHPSAVGVVLPLAAGWTERTRSGLAAGDYTALVDRFRDGPPVVSPLRLPGADKRFNTFEHFVHHEDVLRGGEQWQARELSPTDQQELWDRVRGTARWYLRKAPVPVQLLAPGFGGVRVGDGDDGVTIKGTPGEIVLYINGRGEQARVDISGSDEAVDRWSRHHLGV